MTTRHLVLLALVLRAGTAPAAAQEAPGETPGTIRVGTAEVTLSGRVQTQFNSTTAEGEPATRWLMRRVRLEARVRAGEVAGGKIQPDFSGERFTLRDAYVTLDFSPALRLLFGQAHRPFGILTRFSSLRMPPVEKGAEIRGVRALDEVNLLRDLGYSSRDIGMQASGAPEGAPLGLAYELAVLQGPAAERVSDGGTVQLIARAAVSPAEWLTLGGSWSRRDFAPEAEPSEAGSARRGSALALDLAVEPVTPGLLLLAEVTSGDYDPWRGATFRGAQAWAAYDWTPPRGAVSMVEPLLRVSRGEVEGAAGVDGGTLLTPGLNLYLGGLNRVMANYDVWIPAGGGRAERSFKAMFQLAF